VRVVSWERGCVANCPTEEEAAVRLCVRGCMRARAQMPLAALRALGACAERAALRRRLQQADAAQRAEAAREAAAAAAVSLSCACIGSPCLRHCGHGASIGGGGGEARCCRSECTA
jgi:hypothetical protein